MSDWQVEVPLRLGPQRDLDQYLKHLHTLHSAMQFLDQHSSLVSAQDSYVHAEQVHGKAMKDCEVEFRAMLTQQSSTTMPSAQLLTTQATDNLSSELWGIWHTWKFVTLIYLIYFGCDILFDFYLWKRMHMH